MCLTWGCTHFWDHSKFMPDSREKADSISCWGAVRVGTGLEDGVGAGATNALRISSVVAIRINSWSLTIHSLLGAANTLLPCDRYSCLPLRQLNFRAVQRLKKIIFKFKLELFDHGAEQRLLVCLHFVSTQITTGSKGTIEARLICLNFFNALFFSVIN